MYEHLKDHPIILVTGPFRAGTTIAARILAADTGHEWIDEFAIGVRARKLAERLIRDESGIVLHCPGLSHCIDELAAIRPEETLVVMVHRPIEEIDASRKRLGWSGDRLPPADVYAVWSDRQKSAIRHSLDLDYHSLATHPLWVDRDGRRGWGIKQTSADAAPAGTRRIRGDGKPRGRFKGPGPLARMPIKITLGERRLRLVAKHPRQSAAVAAPAAAKTEQGLGDAVESALSLVGITQARVSRWLGKDCGCAERKQKLNRLGAWAKRRLLGGSEPPPAGL